MKTFVPKQIDGTQRNWYIIDAQDIVLGKLATKIAPILRGKNKTIFTPHLDLGDYVIVVNAEKIKLTGKKLQDKIYYKHTGYIGHLRKKSAEKMMEDTPEKIVELAVAGMIPHNKLKGDILKRLKVVIGSEHQYGAQKPEELKTV